MAQQEGKKPRPLKDVLEEFKSKVIAAARESQQQLANSAEQPDTPVTVEQSAIEARRRKRNSEVDDLLEPRACLAMASTILIAQHADRKTFDSESLTPSGLVSSSIDDSSAARPAPQLAGPAEPCSLKECSDWQTALHPQEIAQRKPLQRLQTATAVLQSRSSQQRQEVQQILDPWNVTQNIKAASGSATK